MAASKSKATPSPAAASKAAREETPDHQPPAPAEAEPEAGAPALSIRTQPGVTRFRRAGRVWVDAPTVVPLADLTAGEIKALRAEPALIVGPAQGPA